MLGLTPDEKKVIVFFVAVIALGNIVLLYKKMHPSFAPELKFAEIPAPIAAASGGDSISQKGLEPESHESNNKKSKITTGRININQAGLGDLQKLPNIGPVMAKKIVDYRETAGKFHKIEDLMKVKGIGNKKFNKLREHVYVDH